MASHIDLYTKGPNNPLTLVQQEDIRQRAFNQVTNHNSLKKRVLAVAAVGSAAVAGVVGIARFETGAGVSVPKPDEPHKLYVAKPGDTAWDISKKAFPGSDPREHTDMIVRETGDFINPGEKISLPDNAAIGTEVSASR